MNNRSVFGENNHKGHCPGSLTKGREPEWKYDLEQDTHILCRGVESGDVELVNVYLAHGLNIESKLWNDGETLLWMASRHGHRHLVLRLLQEGAEVNAKRTSDRYTPLQAATSFGHDRVVQLLLQANADVEAGLGTVNGTSLSIACELGYTNIVRLLCKAGANPHCSSRCKGRSPFKLALENNNALCIQVLLEAGAARCQEVDDALHSGKYASAFAMAEYEEVVSSCDFAYPSAPPLAAERCQIQILKKLTETNLYASVDRFRADALLSAARGGDDSCIKYMLQIQQECSVNLQLSTLTFSRNGVEWLDEWRLIQDKNEKQRMENGNILFWVDKECRKACVNALSMSCVQDPHREVPHTSGNTYLSTRNHEKKYTAAGAQIGFNDVFDDYIIELYAPSLYFRMEHLQKLLVGVAAVRALKTSKEDVVISVTAEYLLLCLTILLDAGCNIHIRELSVSSLASYPTADCRNLCHEILLGPGSTTIFHKYLLKANHFGQNFRWLQALFAAYADQQTGGLPRQSALMWAARLGEALFVEALLEAGANVNRQNLAGETALMHAIICSKPTIFGILLKAHADACTISTTINTALMYAIRVGHVFFTRELIRAGADVNYRSSSGMTALSMALLLKQTHIVKMLMVAGAKPAFQLPYSELQVMV